LPVDVKYHVVRSAINDDQLVPYPFCFVSDANSALTEVIRSSIRET